MYEAPPPDSREQPADFHDRPVSPRQLARIIGVLISTMVLFLIIALALMALAIWLIPALILPLLA